MLIKDFLKNESLTIKTIKQEMFPLATEQDWAFAHNVYQEIDWVNGQRTMSLNEAKELTESKDHREVNNIVDRFNKQLFAINPNNSTLFLHWLPYRMIVDETFFEFKSALEWYDALCDVYLSRKSDEIKINEQRRTENPSDSIISDMSLISSVELRTKLIEEWVKKHPRKGVGPQKIPELNIPSLLVVELIEITGVGKNLFKINIPNIQQTVNEWGEDFIRRFFQGRQEKSENQFNKKYGEGENFKKIIPNTVDTHLDNASKIDLLGRDGLADYLATIIKRVSEGNSNRANEAFLINLDGPWGSGKSTVLNLLSNSLKSEKNGSRGWVIVEFNAWQHQRVQPPWWYLMDTVYRSVIKSDNLSNCEKLWFRLKEQRWRLNIGIVPALIAIFLWVICGILFLFLKTFSYPTFFGISSETLKGLGDLFGVLNASIAFITSMFLAYRYLSYSLTNGSAKSAKKFIELTDDPLKHLKDHFSEMIRWIGHPVCVLIDDLDRCKQEYVVELLEGIQTLFKFAKITYVISADKKWLAESFSESYKCYEKVANVGKSLGDLFMEKTFQLSFAVPNIPEKIKAQYWHYLLQVNKTQTEIDVKAIEQKAKEQFKNTQNEEQIRQKLEEVENLLGNEINQENFTYLQQLRREAILKLTEPEVLERTEHTLEPFLPLLEPNPRSMKRLVNTYGIELTIDILSGGKLGQNQIALWVILKLRWPALAEHFIKFPGDIEKIGKNVDGEKNIPSDLKVLFNDSAVTKVLNSQAIGERIKLGTIQQISNR